jgi:hypothetical protein
MYFIVFFFFYEDVTGQCYNNTVDDSWLYTASDTGGLKVEESLLQQLAVSEGRSRCPYIL